MLQPFPLKTAVRQQSCTGKASKVIMPGEEGGVAHSVLIRGQSSGFILRRVAPVLRRFNEHQPSTHFLLMVGVELSIRGPKKG